MHRQTNHRNRQHAEVTLLTATASLFAASTFALAQDSRIINEPGGMGVNQYGGEFVSSDENALFLFSDDRTGESQYRLRSMDQYGNLSLASVAVESLLEPENGFYSSVEIDMSASGGTILGWKTRLNGTWQFLYKLAWIDPATGAPAADPVEVDEFDRIFVSGDDGALLLHSDDGFLRGRILDSELQTTHGPIDLVDESDLDFPNGINRYDVAFRDDGSFLLAWIGTQPPYFDKVCSRLFDASGAPIGPVNSHSTEIDLFNIECFAATRQDGSFVVAWSEETIALAEDVNEQGDASGAPAEIWNTGMSVWAPTDLSARSEDQWVFTSRNGWFTVDSDTYALDQVHAWGDGTGPANQTGWFNAIDSAIETQRQLGEDGDMDVIGWAHTTDGEAMELGLVADDVDGAYQTHPASASSSSGNAVIAWLDKSSSGDGRIGFQLTDQDGNLNGPNRFIEVANRRMYSPQVAMNDANEFVISWIDVASQDTGGRKSMKYQRFDPNGQPVGTNRLLHIESSSLLSPKFNGLWDANASKRRLILDEDGDLFAVWGMMIVTGGTVGNPQYGRTDIFTKSFNAANQSTTASSNQVVGGKLHAFLKTGETTATVYYADSDENRINTISFHSNGQSAIQQYFPDVPGIGGDFDADRHMDIIVDEAGTSITWNEDNEDHGSRCFVAHYDDSGDLVSSHVLPDENRFSFIGTNEDGSRTIVHGTSSTIRTTILDASGAATGSSTISSDVDYYINGIGHPEFDIRFLSGEFRLTRDVDSGTDQATEIEESVFEYELDPCAPADFDCNGAVNGSDLAMLLGFWGLPETDLNGDGTTDGADLSLLLGAWTG